MRRFGLLHRSKFYHPMTEMGHRTKSLRDSGGMWLVRSVFPTVEIVGNRCCLEDRGIDPQRICCATPNWTDDDPQRHQKIRHGQHQDLI